jgi:AcrR family transcriptional regulator
MPTVFPPGRVRASGSEVAENHRLRIMWAAARVAAAKGYNAATVADIQKLARVNAGTFYRHFADKQETLAAVHELGFQQVIDVTLRAFFAEQAWPQRSWEAGRALTQFLQENPLVAHVGFVEANAVGPGPIQRIEDSHTAFLFFLQEGLLHTGPREPPSQVAMEAIVASVFELIYMRARVAGDPQIAGMLGYIAHLWLTPFLGVKDANAFIERQLRSAQQAHRG